jgi:hypothetical protein
MRHGNLKEAPNYTNAALVMAGVNLLWMFMVIWAAFGFAAVLVTGYALDRLILWCAGRRRAG